MLTHDGMKGRFKAIPADDAAAYFNSERQQNAHGNRERVPPARQLVHSHRCFCVSSDRRRALLLFFIN
jgi:hypothetical protein